MQKPAAYYELRDQQRDFSWKKRDSNGKLGNQ
jgi:hypothetical protein